MKKEIYRYLRYCYRRLFKFYKITNNLFYFSSILYISIIMLLSGEFSFLIWGIINLSFLLIHIRKKLFSKLLLTIIVAFLTISQINYFYGEISKNTKAAVQDIQAEIIESPNIKDYYTELTISASGIPLKIFTKDFTQTNYLLGDNLNLVGELTPINELQLNESYKAYLISKGIGYEFTGKIFKKNNSQNLFINISNELSFKIKEILDRNSLPSTSALIKGMVFGDRSEIPDEIYDQFTSIGVTHILVASGSNFTILVLLIKFIFRKFFNYKITLLISLIVSFILFLIIGPGNVPTERAMFMLLIYIFFELFGRSIRLTTILILYLLITLITYPYLINNVSLQLSVFALLGIVLSANSINRFLEKKIKFKSVNELLSPTISASVFTGIITLTKFGSISLVGLLSNLTILPFIPFIFYISLPMIILNLLNIEILNFHLNYYLNLISRLILLISENLYQLNLSIKSIVGESILLSILLLVIYSTLLIYSDYYVYKNR